MKNNILVVDEKNLSRFSHKHAAIMTPMQYILEGNLRGGNSDVYNLSSYLNYQDIGYYVSLLAEARADKVFPSAATIQELKDKYMQKIYSDELYEKIQSKLKRITSDTFELTVFFGKNVTEAYNSLAWEFFKIFKSPLFRVYFEKDDNWHLRKVKLLTLDELSDFQFQFFEERITEYFYLDKKPRSRKVTYSYDLAILVNSEEKSPPSDAKAIKKFLEAAKHIGMRAETIEYSQRPNIFEYDALFIRETTNVNHHTYRLARRAQKEGLIVIDDPESIVRCTNKIYLEQLADKLNIKRPSSIIISKDNFDKKIEEIKFPCIVKRPDSAFSLGVYKAKSLEELKEMTDTLFKKSQLLLIQEFLPTDFDWRIGVLDGEVLYACKYFMAKGHWQIIENKDENTAIEGDFECVDPKLVDKSVLKSALKVTRAIGNGLYGVDLKQKGNDVYLIEVNDNPSIESGVEDALLGDELYERIMRHFLNQCHKQRRIYE